MDKISPLPEFSAKHYLMLVVLLIIASSFEACLNWMFPSLEGSVLTTYLPAILGLFQIMLILQSVGVFKLPSAVSYSTCLASLCAISFYQFFML